MAAREHPRPVRARARTWLSATAPAGRRLHQALFAQALPRVVMWRLRRDARPGAAALAPAVRAITGSGIKPAEARWIQRIEARRAEFAARAGEISVGLEPLPGHRRSYPPAHLAEVSSIHRPWGVFLLRLVRERCPLSCVELGGAIGISAAYQGAALELNGAGVMRTVEGSPNLAAAARELIAELGLSRVTVVEGRFDDVLEDVLAEAAPVELAFLDASKGREHNLVQFERLLPHLAPGAALVMDDVHWSREMSSAWRRIRAHPRVELSVDLWRLGVCLLTGD